MLKIKKFVFFCGRKHSSHFQHLETEKSKKKYCYISDNKVIKADPVYGVLVQYIGLRVVWGTKTQHEVPVALQPNCEIGLEWNENGFWMLWRKRHVFPALRDKLGGCWLGKTVKKGRFLNRMAFYAAIMLVFWFVKRLKLLCLACFCSLKATQSLTHFLQWVKRLFISNLLSCYLGTAHLLVIVSLVILLW